MPPVLLLRHAQSEWNAVRRWQGWADPPLSALGRHQARLGATRLPFAPGAWAASDLRRAVATAGLLSGAHDEGAPPVVRTDPDLREYDAGDWTGLRRQDIEARWPEELAAWDAGRLDAVPGGESGEQFVRRLHAGLRRAVAAAAGAPLVVVCHGRAIHALATDLGAESLYVAHLAGLLLETDGSTATGATTTGATTAGLRVVGPVALLTPEEARPSGPASRGPEAAQAADDAAQAADEAAPAAGQAAPDPDADAGHGL